jgi:hypothetical protein
VTHNEEEIETNWPNLYILTTSGDYLCIVSKSKHLSASSLDASFAGLGKFPLPLQGLDVIKAIFLMFS